MARRTTILATVTAVACVWSAAASRAQEPAAAPVNDHLFAAAAAANDLAEITVCRLALQRASDAEVKKFAEMMINDHTRTTQELTRIAATQQLALPRMPDVKDQAAADALSGLSGSQFDREFMKGQVAGHMCAVQLFQAEAERGADPNIKAFAAKFLPRIKEHLEMARKSMKESEPKSTSTSR